jgi:linearmycin/streptolysin S transport system permease protein
VIPVVRVNVRRAVGDIRLVIVATAFPVLFILVTGLLAGSPREPVGLVHPPARLLQLVNHTDGLKARVEKSRATLDDDILRGRVVAGLVTLPASAGHLHVQLVTEGANTSAVQARTDVVALLDLMTAEGTRAKVTDLTLAHSDIPAPISPFAYVAPADLVLFLGITVLLLSSGLVESRRLGMLRRLAAAPILGRSVMAAQTVTCLIVAAGQSAGLLLVGRLLFGVHWGNPAAVFVVLLLLALSYAGASGILGSRARSEEQAISVAVVLGIVCGMLGGCLYPLDVVGPVVRVVGHIVPQAWAMDAFVKLIYNNVGFAAVLPEIGALAVFAAVLTFGSVRIYARTMYSPG